MNADPLQRLRDVHAPDAVGWWPLAPGWWFVSLLALAAIAALGLYLWRARQRHAPRREAQRLYRQTYRAYRAGELDAHAYARQSARVLRRFAVFVAGADEARAASGDAWLTVLARTTGQDDYLKGAGRALGNARFRADFAPDVDALHRLIERTLKGAAPPVEPQVADDSSRSGVPSA